MAEQSVPVTVHIQGKEFRIACPEGEQENLLASARHLDKKMQEIRAAGKIIGTDRIAVMAALNLAHELLQVKSQGADDAELPINKVKNLQDKIQVALNGLKQMEL